MSDLSSLSPLTRQVANAIGVCAVESGTPVAKLDWPIFKKWLADTRGLSKEEVAGVAKHLQQAGGFGALRDGLYPATARPEVEDKLVLAPLVKSQKQATVALASQSLFLRQFEAAMEKAFRQGVVKPAGYALKKHTGKTDRVLNVLISDTHFGGNLDPEESLTRYGFVEESRRLASVVRRVLEYKRDHRHETTLVLNLGGDIIENRLHDKAAGVEGALQVADATWLLTNAVLIFSNEFKEVIVNCVSGNHDRSGDRHHRPATTGKWDSEATKIYTGIKTAVWASGRKNVTVNIPKTPFHIYEVFGKRIYVTHGDNNLNPGNPGSRLDVKTLETQINSINIGFQQRGEKPIDLFCMGHVHVGTVIHLPMAELVTNGALSPQGAYGLSIGYYGNACGQSMWESVEGHVLGDYRFLTVDPTIDKDESLDSVIKPFAGL